MSARRSSPVTHSADVGSPPAVESEDATHHRAKRTFDQESVNESGRVRSSTVTNPEEGVVIDPPLPEEAPPQTATTAAATTTIPVEAASAESVEEGEEDDGWQPVWEDSAQAFYFYNRFTGASTWTNPRVPEATTMVAAGGIGNHDRIEGQEEGEEEDDQEEGEERKKRRRKNGARPHGGYDPSIHGDYDPTAAYAQETQDGVDAHNAAQLLLEGANNNQSLYATTGAFNRFTGKWQAATLTPENFNDEHKSRRQMSAFFDVDAAANRHDGKSLKAERAGKKLSKKELKAFKEKRREKKEEKRRAWLRD